MAFPGSIIDEPEFDIDDAAARLIKQWSKKQDKPLDDKPQAAPPKAEDHEEEQEDEVQEEAPEEREDEEETKEEERKAPRKVADDEHEVVVSVDGQDHRVTVKDLKRLFGQEAALTQKSQAVAAAHQEATVQAEKHVSGLNKMIERATERLKPYEHVDWALAAARLPAEDYQQLKAAHEVLKSDVDFYKQELDATVGEFRTKQADAAKLAADACLDALTTPESPAHIEGFNESVYNEIRQYAVSAGMPQQMIDNTYDPVAIKLVHKAMLFDKAQKTAVKKLSNAPKNVNKTPTNDGNASQGSARSAMQKLRQTGDMDDAAAGLLARWEQA